MKEITTCNFKHHKDRVLYGDTACSSWLWFQTEPGDGILRMEVLDCESLCWRTWEYDVLCIVVDLYSDISTTFWINNCLWNWNCMTMMTMTSMVVVLLMMNLVDVPPALLALSSGLDASLSSSPVSLPQLIIVVIIVMKIIVMFIYLKLRNSVSSFHWLSSSIFNVRRRRSFVPHPWHLLSSPLYDVSDHTNQIFSVRIWSWQHVSVIHCWV